MKTKMLTLDRIIIIALLLFITYYYIKLFTRKRVKFCIKIVQKNVLQYCYKTLIFLINSYKLQYLLINPIR